jgi:hypothetical protein
MDDVTLASYNKSIEEFDTHRITGSPIPNVTMEYPFPRELRNPHNFDMPLTNHGDVIDNEN